MVRPIFLRGEAGFEVDGQTYMIVLDAQGWLAAEQTANTSLVRLLARVHSAAEAGDEPLVGDLAAILHGGLQRRHGHLSFEDALNLLMSDYPAVTAALNEAIVGSLPKVEAPEGNATAPKQASGTGKSSSHSGADRGKG